ncbi:MAG: hypothetical protein MUP97_18230 [Acidimicrobiia bacterium]|nr:hypothetical protein [Acidimicrobiia bacterium]
MAVPSTWSYASVVTQAAVPPDKAGEASGVMLTMLIGFAGVAVAVASSALSTGTGTSRSVIGTTLIAFGALAVAVVPFVTAFGRKKSTVS